MYDRLDQGEEGSGCRALSRVALQKLCIDGAKRGRVARRKRLNATSSDRADCTAGTTLRGYRYGRRRQGADQFAPVRPL